MPRYRYTVDRTFFLLLARSGIGEAEKHLNQLCEDGARLHSQGHNFLIIEREYPVDMASQPVPAEDIGLLTEPDRVPRVLLEEIVPPPRLDTDPTP